MIFSILVNPFSNSFPFGIGLQYIRIDPYVYAHRIHDNDYTSYQIGLGSNLQPNSESILASVSYKPHYRVGLRFLFQTTEHGANELDSKGNTVVNHGGDILVGHRPGDSEYIKFLDGVLEKSYNYQLEIKYEPIKNYIFTINSIYQDRKNNTESVFDDFYFNLLLALKI